MRKTMVCWNSGSLNLLENQVYKLKSLQVSYPQIILSSSLPTQVSMIYDYILICSSQAYQKGEGNQNQNLIGIIVYCLQLPSQKQRKLKNLGSYCTSVQITNSFRTVIQKIIQLLGYDPITYTQETGTRSKPSLQIQELDQQIGNRFIIAKKSQTNPQQEFSNPQEYLMRGKRILMKMFELDFKIEQTKLQLIKEKLEKQIHAFLKLKNSPIIQKEFTILKRADTLQQLCQACIYFYTLQKPQLYYNLNLILKNLRYLKFQAQFSHIKIFAFLLMLNYFFVFRGQDPKENCGLLYRYTDYSPDNFQIGSIVAISSFYSVSSREIDQQKLKKTDNKRKTKMVIHRVSHKDTLVTTSCIPAYLYSAYPKQQQYLFAPFTRFKILTKAKNVIHIQQLPTNFFIAKILDMNLYPQNAKNNKFNWQLNYMLKYDKNPLPKCSVIQNQAQRIVKKKQLWKINVMIRTNINLGLLHFNHQEKYKIALAYFQKALQYVVKQNMKNDSEVFIWNNIGLTYYKLEDYKQARKCFKKALQMCKKESFFSNIYNNMASLSEAEGKVDQALILYEKGLSKQREQDQNKNQILQAILLNNIAFCKITQFQADTSNKKYKKQAINLLNEVIAKYTALFGNDICSYVVACLQNISRCYELQDNLIKSIQYLQKAAQIQKKLIKDFSYDQNSSNNLLNLYIQIGKCYNKLQKYQNALKNYQEALPLSLSLNGQNHRTTSIIYSNIASVHESIGNFEQAVSNFDKSLDILMKPFRQQNQDIFNFVIDMRSLLVSNISKVKQLQQRIKDFEQIQKKKKAEWQSMMKQKYS